METSALVPQSLGWILWTLSRGFLSFKVRRICI